jgi:hypothetical protein
MHLYNQRHRFYAGIDLHARSMFTSASTPRAVRYFVFDAALVARSLAADHSWVGSFLDRDQRSNA